MLKGIYFTYLEINEVWVLLFVKICYLHMISIIVMIIISIIYSFNNITKQVHFANSSVKTHIGIKLYFMKSQEKKNTITVFAVHLFINKEKERRGQNELMMSSLMMSSWDADEDELDSSASFTSRH